MHACLHEMVKIIIKKQQQQTLLVSLWALSGFSGFILPLKNIPVCSWTHIYPNHMKNKKQTWQINQFKSIRTRLTTWTWQISPEISVVLSLLPSEKSLKTSQEFLQGLLLHLRDPPHTYICVCKRKTLFHTCVCMYICPRTCFVWMYLKKGNNMDVISFCRGICLCVQACLCSLSFSSTYNT